MVKDLPPDTGNGRGAVGVVVQDGSGVHDVGELLMHTGNWGAFGSYPGAGTPISQFPSAEWPAGSGIEHLNIAGLWVGAQKGSLPGSQYLHVSTAAYDMEFRPTPDPVDRIYETAAGAPGGIRLPWPGADDDGDGLVDEDPLDGRDNDGDGLIDEDFAAISDQMFSSWYTDDQPEAISEYPEHQPLGIMVRQESYQWTDPRFDDFVGVSFTVTNTSGEDLSNVYLGMFLDFDTGPGADSTYWKDFIAYWEGTRETELGWVSIYMAYVCDTDNGKPESYMGAMLLGHTTSPDGIAAPAAVGITSFQVFSGDQPYENGGMPVNDYQRYELMSRSQFDRNQSVPRDNYRALISTGAFELVAGEEMEYDIGFVCGATLDELLDNAARCQRLYDGLWFDADHDPSTGIDGRETQVHWILERPALAVDLDIKPGSCPNPFNINVFDLLSSGNPNKGGVLPVAIAGTGSFDVRDIDVSTVRLEQAAPLEKGRAYEDIVSPADTGPMCGCSVTGPDGHDDLVLKFSKQQIASSLLDKGIPEAGHETKLVIRGNLYDGTHFEGADCVIFVGPPPETDHVGRDMLAVEKTRLLGATPNPFNPSTIIRYEIASPGRVTLKVYDAGGRLIRTLVDRDIAAGRYEESWDGRCDNGSIAASGVYFYRLSASGSVETKKMVMLK